MEHSGLFIFKFLSVMLILANLHPFIFSALSANSCKAGNAIEVSWNDNYGYDYEPFPIQVENTCRFCDAHNVILHLQIFCINLNSDPVDEKVIVNNGKSIHPGQELTFTYSVNCQASIQSAQATAEFINCI